MSSFRKIRYDLRPAKHIERKMLSEIFQRISLGNPRDYRYIGFGSTYFSDFTLFHKVLGIEDMISIESNPNVKRFHFNKPFGCIRLEMGLSHLVLPRLDWNRKTVLWLDYDGQLSANSIVDVRTFTRKALPGSVLIISVNAEPDKKSNVDPLQKLVDEFNQEMITIGLRKVDLQKWGLAREYRKIVLRAVKDELEVRNSLTENKISFQQIMNFHYSDGAKMLTVGGVLSSEGNEMPSLASIDFVRDGEEPFLIDVPNLTPREMKDAEKLLPGGDLSPIYDVVPASDVNKYRILYRWFPNFADVQW